MDPNNNRARRHPQMNALSITDQHKNNDIKENNNERLSLPTHRSDATVDPV